MLLSFQNHRIVPCSGMPVRDAAGSMRLFAETALPERQSR